VRGSLATWSDAPDYLAVSFTCLDCGARLTRFVQRDPNELRRCLSCEADLTRLISTRLLTLVFGNAPGDGRPSISS
jgi:hypothetical protein